jgi:hypothetical protein
MLESQRIPRRKEFLAPMGEGRGTGDAAASVEEADQAPA